MSSNAADLSRRFEEAERNILRAKVKTLRGALQAGARYARRLAPVKTGDLKSNIRVVPIKATKDMTYGSIVSDVNKSFPYHLWVNGNIKSIRIGNKRRTYASTRHTGIPGYMNWTFKYVKLIVPATAKVELNNGLGQAFK